MLIQRSKEHRIFNTGSELVMDLWPESGPVSVSENYYPESNPGNANPFFRHDNV